MAKAAAATAAVAVVALIAIPAAFAAFAARSENPADLVTAAPDFTAPAITAVAIGKTQGGATGFVKQAGTYYVYANLAADTGNPASGVATVTADVQTVTTGGKEVPLVAGTYTAGGASYNYRSVALVAAAVLGEGSKSFTVTATDVAGNAGTVAGSVTVDNTAPRASDIQTTNVAGGNNGLAEQGDTIVFTFSEPVEPETILGGWNGSPTNVVVRVNDNGLLGLPTANDSVQVWNAANLVALPLGVIDLGRGDYASGVLGGNFRFGASGTPSTMSMSTNTLTVVLGTYGSTSLVDPARGTAAAAGTMTWAPEAIPTDRAANAMSTAAASESGSADKDF